MRGSRFRFPIGPTWETIFTELFLVWVPCGEFFWIGTRSIKDQSNFWCSFSTGNSLGTVLLRESVSLPTTRTICSSWYLILENNILHLVYFDLFRATNTIWQACEIYLPGLRRPHRNYCYAINADGHSPDIGCIIINLLSNEQLLIGSDKVRIA